MKQVDLEPGDYTERKPRGWRWKLPAGHPDNALVPFVMFGLTLAAVAYILLNLPAGHSLSIVGCAVGFAFVAGGMFVLWTRR